MEIDQHIGCAMSGLIADARTLVEHSHRFSYGEPMTVESTTQALCDLALRFGEGDEESMDLTLLEAETIALSILKQVMEEKVTPNNVDIAKVSPTYHLYTPAEVEAVIGRL
ncbi:Proteasome subunit alpha type-5 [Linum perenne]